MDNVTEEGFCPVDLRDWLALAEKAGVPHVPSTTIATAPISSIRMFDVEEGEHVEDLKSFFGAVNAAVEVAKAGPPAMLRWSCCSMSDVKNAVNRGKRAWSESFLYLTPDDMRAYDIISEMPRPTISAHLRPWIALKERTSDKGAFGLEVRVFVADDEIKGISAYYPQCPLDADDADVQRLVETARAYTNAMIAMQTRPLVVPQVKGLHGTCVNAWSADFVMSAEGEVLFLEGGPPTTPYWGSHPCCFNGAEIEGIALAPRVPVDEYGEPA